MKKIIDFFFDISIHKTIYFNLYYFNFKTAIKFPVFISKNVVLKNMSGQIELPNNCKTGIIKIGFKSIGIFDHKRSKSIWELKGRIIFKGNSFFGQGTKISVDRAGELVIGNNLSITGEVQIVSVKKVLFGSDCLVSWDCLIMDTDFHKIFDSNNNILNQPKEVIIGDNVRIGCRSIILKGSKIANNCILGSGSLITNHLSDSNSIYAGNPIKKIKENISWAL